MKVLDLYHLTPEDRKIRDDEFPPKEIIREFHRSEI